MVSSCRIITKCMYSRSSIYLGSSKRGISKISWSSLIIIGARIETATQAMPAEGPQKTALTMCQKRLTRASFVCAQIQNRCPKSLSRFCVTFPKAKLCRHTPDQVVKTVCRTCVCLGDPDICGLTREEAVRASTLSSISKWGRSRRLDTRISPQLKLSRDRLHQECKPDSNCSQLEDPW